MIAESSARIYAWPNRKKPGRKTTSSRLPSCEVVCLASKREAKQAAPCKSTAHQAYDLYQHASAVDEQEPALAIPMYEQAITLNPTLAVAYTNLGNCHYRLKRSELAAELYRQALAIDAAQPEALYNLGYLLLEAGASPHEAIRLFREAIRHDPSFADAYFNLAMALEQSGAHCDSLPVQHAWRKYIALEPHGTWTEIARRHLA